MESTSTTEFANYLLEMANETSKIKLEHIKLAVKEAMPEKYAKEKELSFEDAILDAQKRCDIYTIKTLASKYGVTILEDNFYFLCNIESFDKRNIEINDEKDKIEKEFNSHCKKRLNTLRTIKYITTNKSFIGIKGHDKITLSDKEFNDHLSEYILNKLFQENKLFYCNQCGWNEETKKEANINDLDIMMKAEEKLISIYEEFTNENERDIAIMFSLLAKLLHKIEVFNEFIIKPDCEVNPLIKINYDNTWANTSKSCFMVDLFVHYNVIPRYMTDKTPQEKYQYIKAKLKQADKTISKYNNIDNQ